MAMVKRRRDDRCGRAALLFQFQLIQVLVAANYLRVGSAAASESARNDGTEHMKKALRGATREWVR